jgi:hypothetical protein
MTGPFPPAVLQAMDWIRAPAAAVNGFLKNAG